MYEVIYPPSSWIYIIAYLQSSMQALEPTSIVITKETCRVHHQGCTTPSLETSIDQHIRTQRLL